MLAASSPVAVLASLTMQGNGRSVQSTAQSDPPVFDELPLEASRPSYMTILI